MAGIIKNTERINRLKLVAGEVYTLQFTDTTPSVIQIRNNYSDYPIYMGLGSYVTENNYDISVIGGGTRVFTKPAGTKFVYFFTLSPTEIIVNSWEAEGVFPADIDQSQMSILVKDTTGDSTVIVDNIVNSLPSGNNTIGKVNNDSLGTPADSEFTGSGSSSIVGLLKGLFTKLSSIVLGAGSNTIGKVDINAGSNLIGKVDINTMPDITIDGSGLTISGDVNIGSSLPAGTNNIGDVDIASALPSGSNTIGNVGISSALPTGSNTIGKVLNDSIGNVADSANTNSTGSWTMIALLKGIWTAVNNSSQGGNSVATYPTLSNINMTNANAEYSVSLPSNTKRFTLSVVDGDDTFNYRVAYVTGKVGSQVSPFLKYNGNVEFSVENVDTSNTGLVVYFACSVAGKKMQVESWRS
jgi:hypothetical protein